MICPLLSAAVSVNNDYPLIVLIMKNVPLVTLPKFQVSTAVDSLATQFAATLRWQIEVGEEVRTVAWLPDHSAVLVLTGSGRVVQLRAADGQPMWGHTAPGDGAVCLSVCPSAPLVATGHLNGKLRLRTAATGKLVSEQQLGPSWVDCVAWSPNGQLLAATSGRVLHLLDATGQPLACYQGHDMGIDAICWRTDSGAFATASGNTARLFTMPTASVPLEPNHVLILSGTRPLTALQWCSTGQLLVASLTKGQLGCWHLPSGKSVSRRVIGRLGAMQALSWQGDGRRLALTYGSGISLWEFTAASLSRMPMLLTHHTRPIQQLVFQHQGHLLASADTGGTLALWNPPQQATPCSVHTVGSAIISLDWMTNDCCLALGTVEGRVAVISTVSS